MHAGEAESGGRVHYAWRGTVCPRVNSLFTHNQDGGTAQPVAAQQQQHQQQQQQQQRQQQQQYQQQQQQQQPVRLPLPPLPSAPQNPQQNQASAAGGGPQQVEEAEGFGSRASSVLAGYTRLMAEAEWNGTWK